jgi:hypothetical protein
MLTSALTLKIQKIHHVLTANKPQRYITKNKIGENVIFHSLLLQTAHNSLEYE